MNKQFLVSSMVIMLSTPFSVNADTSNTVEVMLVSTLDEERGYCLDIAGGQGVNAPLDRGLQAHTCYHYKGRILEDQGFDEELIKEGRFLITYFDVCMSVSSVVENETISLQSCNDADTQKFILKPNGNLVTAVDPNLCITVSSTEKKEGRGSSPVHVMRPVTLQVCDDSKDAYQIWSTNKI